ncbi:MAG: PilZ domain-containing protein [Acidobacteria bacterium]|nr:PilZ domain-containing protein [Acidobacteriota bacterium]
MDRPPAPLRRPATGVPGITGLRFLPQRSKATLVNISATGLLAESSARMVVGSRATVLFEGEFTPGLVAGRVVRSEVAVVGHDGLLRYHIAIEFDSPLRLNDEPTEGEGPAAEAVRNRW